MHTSRQYLRLRILETNDNVQIRSVQTKKRHCYGNLTYKHIQSHTYRQRKEAIYVDTQKGVVGATWPTSNFGAHNDISGTAKVEFWWVTLIGNDYSSHISKANIILEGS